MIKGHYTVCYMKTKLCTFKLSLQVEDVKVDLSDLFQRTWEFSPEWNGAHLQLRYKDKLHCRCLKGQYWNYTMSKRYIFFTYVFVCLFFLKRQGSGSIEQQYKKQVGNVLFRRGKSWLLLSSVKILFFLRYIRCDFLIH